MKRILLTTTSLVLAAGVAQADVSFSGTAGVALIDDNGASADVAAVTALKAVAPLTQPQLRLANTRTTCSLSHTMTSTSQLLLNQTMVCPYPLASTWALVTKSTTTMTMSLKHKATT